MAIKNAALRILFRLPAGLYSIGCGWLLGRRFLLLEHVGRRTGVPRNTVLEVMERREDELIVMVGFGRQSDWLRNLKAHPDQVTVTVGRKRFAARFRFLELDEAVASHRLGASGLSCRRRLHRVGRELEWLLRGKIRSVRNMCRQRWARRSGI